MKYCIPFIFLYFLNWYVTTGEVSNNTNITIAKLNEENCEIDKSCNISETEITIFNETISRNDSSKWKYETSGATEMNNITVDNHNSNVTNIVAQAGNSTAMTVNETELLQNQTKKPTNIKYPLRLGTSCRCDEKKGSCDINCCCDSDCAVVNRDIFEKCTYSPEDYINEDCSAKIFNSPMFCVVKDNLYSKHFYPNKPIVEQLEKVDRLLRRNDLFGWSLPSEHKVEKLNFEEEYKIGSKIWMVANNTVLFPFVLPNSMITPECRIEDPVLYVQNTERKCHWQIGQFVDWCNQWNSPQNAEVYYKNITIISTPDLMNMSALNCTKHCISITPYICQDDNLDDCKIILNNTTWSPTYNTSSKQCRNIVTRVHYIIYHNGIEGISSANVYFQLANITSANHSIRQAFKVTFHWRNETKYFERSGFPGYLRNKPIISGFKNLTVNTNGSSKISMIMSYRNKEWLTVFKPSLDNICRKIDRKNILFRQNIYAHCYIKVPPIQSTEQCDQLQNEIFETVLGPHINISNWYISAYGDPDVGNLHKWAPVLLRLPTLPLNETCNGLVTSFKLDILHSITGEFSNPQETIFGVVLTGKAFEHVITKVNILKITIMANFYDITNHPLRIFAEPPTYEVKLPPDFFYPFLSDDNSDDTRAEDRNKKLRSSARINPRSGGLNDGHLEETDWSTDKESETCPICLFNIIDQLVGSPINCEPCFCFKCLMKKAESSTCPVDRLCFNTIVVRKTIGGKII